MTDATATCRHCGRPFTPSRAGRTVHCPDHRTAASRRRATIATTGPVAVDPTGLTCTIRTATTGVCGRPAVRAFVSTTTDDVFAECAAHVGR